jgi:hypothetical protein
VNLNDFILASGDDTRKVLESKPMKKTKYVNLKDGESLRGFLLTTDLKLYMAHGDFQRKIKTHTCKNPKNLPHMTCLSCQHGVKRSKKAIVPFWNVDTQQIEVFDASLKALKVVLAFIDGYEEESTVTPIALTRSGSGTDTTYTLMPVRVRPAEKLLFVKPENIMLDGDFYRRVLNIPDDMYVKQLLGITDEQQETA